MRSTGTGWVRSNESVSRVIPREIRVGSRRPRTLPHARGHRGTSIIRGKPPPLIVLNSAAGECMHAAPVPRGRYLVIHETTRGISGGSPEYRYSEVVRVLGEIIHAKRPRVKHTFYDKPGARSCLENDFISR